MGICKVKKVRRMMKMLEIMTIPKMLTFQLSVKINISRGVLQKTKNAKDLGFVIFPAKLCKLYGKSIKT